MKPYGVISDTHNHNFSAFATTTEVGLNSRLVATLDEFERCAKTVAEMGGNIVRHAGDLFHVRGSIAPSVLNPTRDRLEHIHKTYGVEFEILAGNHDLEGKHASRLGNAVEACRCDYVRVISSPTWMNSILMVPWYDKIADLKDYLKRTADSFASTGDLYKCHLILHAPIDGVIAGLPDHGLSADWLAELGFDVVMSGHYHNHKDFGNGVFSVGALTHQTWSDVGSKAGFLTVNDKVVKWHCTNAPQFLQINADDDPDEIGLRVPGNFVRAKVKDADAKRAAEVREWLTKLGAMGVQIDIHKTPTTRRTGVATIKAGATVEQSITQFVKDKSFTHAARVEADALKLLAEVA